MPCEPPCIAPRDIIGNAKVREMCGGISRHTLIAWRARYTDFPKPIRRIRSGGGWTELWDRRAVRAWLAGR